MTASSIDESEVGQINQVVCVMTHLRAGSGLLSSLLDSHPNLLSTPDDILMGFYEFWDKHGELAAEELVSAFLDYYAVLFDAWSTCKCPRVGPNVGDDLNWTTLGAARDEKLYVDQEVFKSAIEGFLNTRGKVSRKLFFQALHAAYAKALGWQVKNAQIVFGLHVPHDRPLQQFFADFPDGRFLQMTRHPISALSSHFRHYFQSGYLHPNAAPGMVSSAISGPFVPRKSHAQWRGIKLEDLHQHPRETMQRVCDWLEIPWDETLIQSTVNGKQWWNEKGRPQVTGPSDIIIKQSSDDVITPFDRFRLNVLTAKRCQSDGYEVKSRYLWTVTRLLVLPLLAIPLKIEFLSMFSLTWGPFSRGITAVDPNTKSKVSRFSDAIHAIYLGRRVLLGAWLRLFTNQGKQLEMI